MLYIIAVLGNRKKYLNDGSTFVKIHTIYPIKRLRFRQNKKLSAKSFVMRKEKKLFFLSLFFWGTYFLKRECDRS